MLLQSWQIIAILVIAGVFGFGIGRTFGESRAWKQMDKLEQVRLAFDAIPSYCEQEAARFAREGFTADEQAAIAESMTMEQDMARQFARHLTEGDQPIAGIRYEEDDAPVHTYESPFCEDETCPCHFGHVLNGRIIVEQESM